MLLCMKLKTFNLKKISSNLPTFLEASKMCCSSFAGSSENDDRFDEPFHRSENRTQRKFGSNSSYYKNSRFNHRFPNKKPEYFGSYWPNRISKNNSRSPSTMGGEKNQLHWDKFIYTEHPDITNRTDDEVENYHKEMNIRTTGKNIPKPITKFSELCLPENLFKALNSENYLEPTPIQSQGWPVALSGRDMIGVSQTGSGKTLAYMLPAVVHAANQCHSEVERRESSPQVLILGPTRELIQQIYKVSEKFIQACGLSGAMAYGGASRNFQLHCLQGAEICIATPGRLIDFLSCGNVNLENCSYLVLDEADRMLDMGFEPQIREIINHIRIERQTLMWSATWPSEIRNLAKDFLNDFIHVTIGSSELVANPNIEQQIFVMNEDEKEERLFSLLQCLLEERDSKVLVFAQTKRKVDYLTKILNRKSIPSLGIHGDISQSRRDNILNSFRMNNKSAVLIATDIAARGLDIKDINHIVNFDFPLNIEDYIHRIGRTARGSASGVAHSFFTIENSGLIRELFSVLKKANQAINPDLYALTNIERKKSSKFGNYKNYKRRVYG